jgi:hypothetical protein
MAASPIKAIRIYPAEAAACVLCLAALVYVGTAVGALVMLAALGVLTGWIAFLEDAPRQQAARGEPSDDDQEMSDDVKNRIGTFLVCLAIFGFGYCQFFWYVAAYIPQPQYGGILVTTPRAWVVANLSGLLAALVAYRHSPHDLRIFLTVGAATCVVGILLLSSVVPVLLSR